jgi:nucleoside-diphosphate-sugar epimerase
MVYGLRNRRAREADPIRPADAYAMGKALGESLCEWSSRVDGICVTVLRYGTVYAREKGSTGWSPGS